MTNINKRIDEIMELDKARTQGDWLVDKVPTSCGHCFRVGSPEQLVEKDNSSRPTMPSYACLYVDYGNASQESEANARLIAKAPEMVSIIRELRSELTQLKKELANK